MTVSAGKLLLRGVRLTECHLGVVEIVVFRTAHGFAAYARRLVLERAPAWLTAYRRIAVLGGGRRRGRRGRRGRAPQPCAGRLGAARHDRAAVPPRRTAGLGRSGALQPLMPSHRPRVAAAGR
jgi:transposase